MLKLVFEVPTDLKRKCGVLEEFLSPHTRIALACSGGVDSTFLAWFLVNALGKKAVGFLAHTPFIGRREFERAGMVAMETGLELETLHLDPRRNPNVAGNPKDRCYFCKREILTGVIEAARRRDCTAVCDGSNADDSRQYRPGARALSELGVLSPLAAAGFKKEEIRQLSRLAGLSTWNKPSESCLATRIPYGTPLSDELLERIERAEGFLVDMGLSRVRVRVHGDLARIELNPEVFSRLLDTSTRESVLDCFRRLGFLHVVLDLAGYRTGSWDNPL